MFDGRRRHKCRFPRHGRAEARRDGRGRESGSLALLSAARRRAGRDLRLARPTQAARVSPGAFVGLGR
jgi:hypothetical protein